MIIIADTIKQYLPIFNNLKVLAGSNFFFFGKKISEPRLNLNFVQFFLTFPFIDGFFVKKAKED